MFYFNFAYLKAARMREFVKILSSLACYPVAFAITVTLVI